MPGEPHELTLYVQSKKAVTSFYQPAVQASPMGTTVMAGAASPTGEGGAVSDTPVYFLSDDQSRAAALVEELGVRRGYAVKIVDISKAGRLERLVTEHLRGVQNFPVLISPNGHRLEGCAQFTEEAICAMMPADLKSVRAFTYLKVRGGDLDRIRRLLESYPEVKELHFLTGDWDILVVLEFPGSTKNKRIVLDFVTERIRAIPEVLDTSTIVPEYSVSKFPVSG
jgi:DNA-binding Lrp family transcriptional regulator